MNKKDYKAIAGIIKENTNKVDMLINHYTLTMDLVDYFERENLQDKNSIWTFNRKTFLKEAGVE